LRTIRKAVQTFIIEVLLSLPEPHGIYRPPDFHIGLLLLDAKRLHEAAELLQAEELRKEHADTAVRAAVRRRMKELNNFMFSRYLSMIA